MLSHITTILLLTLPLFHPTHAQQSPLASLPSTLAHLSSLFTATPSSLPPTTTQPCCAPSCPPQACNIHLPSPSSDLTYLYPLPSTTGPAPSKVTFPCCGPSCPDGACRAPGALVGSERPTVPPQATQTGKVPEGGRLNPGFAAGGDGEASIIIGCCKKCKGCIQSAGPGDGDGGSTAAEEMLVARATASPSAGAGDGDGAGGGEDPTPPNARPQPPILPPAQPHRPNTPQICVGCVGGVCFPCIGSAFAPPVAFTPAGVDGGEEEGVGHRAASVVSSVAAAVVGGGSGTTEGEEAEPQPTILMAADVADAVKGVNQDVVPVVVQSFGPGQDGEPKAKGEWELLTLLASVDLKVQDNYLSHRVVEALGLGEKVKALKKGTGKTAVLSAGGQAVAVDGYVDMGIVIGSRSGIVIGSVTENEEVGEWRLLRGVRWFVYGRGGDDALVGSPDVVLGTKILAEAGGLSVTEGVRRKVQAGVKVLGLGHFVGAAAEGPGGTQFGKDEL